MILYIFFSLVAFLLYIQAGVFLLLRKPVDQTNRLFAYMLLSLAWVSLFLMLIQLANDSQDVYLLDRINMFGWLALPFLTVLFFVNATKINLKRIRYLFIILGFLAVVLMVRYFWHPQSLKHFYESNSGLWYYSANIQSVWVIVAVVYNLGCAFSGFALTLNYLIKSEKVQGNKKKLQSKVFLLSFSLFLLVSISSHIIFPLIYVPAFPAMIHIAAVPLVGVIFFSTILVHPQTFFREMISDIFIRRIREFVFFLDHNGLIYSVNQYTMDVLKYNLSDMFNKEPGLFLKPPALVAGKLEDAIMNHKTDDLICLITPRDGDEFPVQLNITKVYDAFRNMVGFLLIAYDYRQIRALQLERNKRLRVEKKLVARNLELEKRIQEKNTELLQIKKRLDAEHLRQEELERQVLIELNKKGEMVRELHHRVKNNIQMTISLINMERSSFDSDQRQNHFYESIANRILTISMIHDYLYDTPRMGKINLNHYVLKIMGELRSIHQSKSHIQFNVSFDEALLSIGQAIPCGIIIFELLNNSLQHAFPEEDHIAAESARINLGFVSEGSMSQILFSDNGTGIALKNGKPVRKNTGLTLVELLIKEYLHGKINYCNIKGTSIQVGFNHNEKKGL